MININDAHQWILKTLKKNYGGFSSPSDLDRAIESASIDVYNQLIKQFKEDSNGNIPSLLKNFSLNTTGSTTSRILTIAGASSEVISVSTVIDSNEYPARIAKNDLFFNRRNYEDMEMDVRDGNPRHLFKQEETYTLVAASDRLQDLPTDFNKEIQLFYKDGQNNYFEGEILSDREFAERLVSVIIAPDLENPIARIVGDQIEFYPRPTGVDTYDYVLSFYKYPVPERALIRIEGDDATDELKVEVYPDVPDLKVYYIKKPTKAVFAYTSAGGVVTYDSGSSTHLDWDYKSFNLIMTQALFYLGFAIKDGEISQIPAARNQVEATKDQITR
jgi:hypothetical protein